MKARVTEIRAAIVAELEFLRPTHVKEIVATLDDQAAFEAQLPFIRIKRGDSDIEVGSLQEWQHELEISVTYVDLLSQEVDEKIDYILEEISNLITRSESIDQYIDYVEPTNISIDSVDSDSPMIAATITFKINYSQGV